MLDVEKVIKGLECCVLRDPDDSRRCAECPKSEYGRTISNSCINGLMVAALALLKAQEPIEPTKPDEDNMVYCGACGTPVGYEVLEPHGMDYIRYNYCPNCGRNVRWE